ncbi:MAG: sensor histidine kinase [Cytophagaceae bacterium]|jgi:hypothetical protein|nr:sensor histidine kinase [Cytophagaceae bacterium]
MSRLFSFVRLTLLSLLALTSSNVVALDTLVLTEKYRQQQFLWGEKFIELYKSNHKEIDTLSTILSLQKQNYFYTNKGIDFWIHNPNQDYWGHVVLKSAVASNKQWIIELFDFHIDDYDIYVIQQDSVVYHFKGGDTLSFFSREIAHKNFAHQIKIDSGAVTDLYIRIHSQQEVSMLGSVRDASYFIYYSNKEYFLLSIFYGLVLTAGLSFLFTYLHLRQISYFYVSLYCFALALLHLSNDGLGYQYLWGNSPIWNSYTRKLGMLFVMTSLLLYTRSFLNLSKFHEKLSYTFVLLIGFRIVMGLIELNSSTILLTQPIDIILFAIIFIVGAYTYWKYEYKPARYFMLAFTCLLLGFLYNKAMVAGYIPRTIFGFYSFNWGSIAQIILFTLSLADRMYYLNNQVMDARNELIVQLKEKEMLKDKVNRELEEKVRERTKELEYKNQQLDLFIYKASHDIKGPLKSILGLTRLGKIDIYDPKALEYIQHIEKSTQRLDLLVHDLLEISKLKQTRVQQHRIDFGSMIQDIKESLQHLDGFSDFNIYVNINQNQEFYQDKNMMYSIFQNIIENAFKYRDTSKSNAHIEIAIDSTQKRTIIEFKDNGIGIEPELTEKIFDMFFQAHDHLQGSGLGLYLVRLAVEKIGGKIQVESNIGKGTHFHLVL